MPSSYTATDAQAYEHLMGRWSGRLAKELIAFAGIATGDRVLDVGCGTGSMALALAERPEPAAIVGIDIAAPYIAYASARSTDPRLTFSPLMRLLWNCRPAALIVAFHCSLSTSCRIPPGRSTACAG
jgi:trans-aconitate methyltransferase